MGFQISPSVDVKEFDITGIVPAVSTTVGAVAGVYSWGPVEDATLCSDENNYKSKFLGPTDSNFETWFTGANFLGYGSAMYVSRAAANALNAVGGPAVTNTTPGFLIKNETDFTDKITSLDTGTYYYVAKYPGLAGSSLRVSVCDSVNAFSQTFAAIGATTPNITATVGSNNVVLTVTNDDSNTALATQVANNILNGIVVGDFIRIGDANTGTQFVKVASKGSMTTVNTSVVTSTISISNIVTLAQNVSSNTITRFWEFHSLVETAPTTSVFTENRGGSGDEMHIVIVDAGGRFSGTRGTILEVHNNVSRARNATGPQGGSIYYKNVINQSSRYVWAVSDRSASGPAETIVPVNTTPLNVQMYGGTDGETETTISVAALARAYDKFKSAEDIDVSLIMQGKARGGVMDSQLANYLIDNITEVRKDCVVFISPRREAVVNNYNAPEEAVVAFRNQLRSTSYAFLDCNYKYQYDKYNDVYRWVPLNGDIAGLAARTDTLRDPWWSFAGFNRGQIKNIIKLAYNPSKAQRDELYKNGANPVVTFNGEGTILYGDKTLLSKPSAFDRINVRRLFIVLEKAIAVSAKYLLFEINDEFTRAQFVNMVEPYLRDIKGRRGIYDFRVQCDDKNNTPEVLDSNRFIGDIFIKPARSINFITLNFSAVRTGVSFEEIAGQPG